MLTYGTEEEVMIPQSWYLEAGFWKVIGLDSQGGAPRENYRL